MAGRTSKMKGKAGERSFRDKIREHGFDAERGWADGYDIKSSDLDGYHFEVKRGERTKMYEWMNQAIGDAGTKIPVVAHRKNRGKWHVFISADNFLELLKQKNKI